MCAWKILQDVAVKGLRFGFATNSRLGYLSVGKNQEEGEGRQGEGGGGQETIKPKYKLMGCFHRKAACKPIPLCKR